MDVVQFLLFVSAAIAWRAQSALQSMLQQDDAVLRARALWLLGGIQGEGEKHVKEALQDKDGFVRQQAVQALGRYGPAAHQAIPQLTAALQDPSSQVRDAAAVAKEKIESSRRVKPRQTK